MTDREAKTLEMDAGGGASASHSRAVVYDRAVVVEGLAATEANLHTLLRVYGQRLERGTAMTAACSTDQGVSEAEQATAAAAAALPELQHHATAFLASAKALDDHFIALQDAAGDESAASISQEIEQLKAELAEKDSLLAKQADSLVKWQLLFAKLAADATAMADDPEA